MSTTKVIAAAIGLLMLAACGPEINRRQAVCVLVDMSGTYTKELGKAQRVVNYLLGSLQPGDTLAVVRIQSRSFSEKDIVAKVTLSLDPVQANGDKRHFDDEMTAFVKSAEGKKGSLYTDITGGMMEAAEFLNETGAHTKTIIVFSDMQEELDNQTVRDFPIKLDGIRIIALNVTKLNTDNRDPRRYVDRLARWEKRARAAGASEWRVVNDLEHLERVFNGRG